MRKSIFILSIILFILLSPPSCHKNDDSHNHLAGNWTRLISGRLCTLTITEDNKWQVDFTDDSATDVWGRFIISGNQITILDVGGVYMSTTPGIYTYAVTESTLTFFMVNDPVNGRETVIQGVWTKV